MTAQQRWKREQIARGLCKNCARPRWHYAAECDGCRIKARRAERQRLGTRPYDASERGRVPRVAED